MSRQGDSNSTKKITTSKVSSLVLEATRPKHPSELQHVSRSQSSQASDPEVTHGRRSDFLHDAEQSKDEATTDSTDLAWASRFLPQDSVDQALQVTLHHPSRYNDERLATIIKDTDVKTAVSRFPDTKDLMATNENSSEDSTLPGRRVPDVVFSQLQRFSLPEINPSSSQIRQYDRPPEKCAYPASQEVSGRPSFNPNANSGPCEFSSLTYSASTSSLPRFGSFINLQDDGGTRSDSVTSLAIKSAVSGNQPLVVETTDHSQKSAPLGRKPDATTMPVFNHETFDHVHVGMGDNFMGWLFDDEQRRLLDAPLPDDPYHQYEHASNFQLESHMHDPIIQAHHLPGIFTIPSVLDSGLPESVLSEARRKRLLIMIMRDFRDERHLQVTQLRRTILEGNHDSESHVLSLHMLQIYISSFWLHVHSQLPILHRPTYSTETCPDLLLIAIIALGASCLERDHGYETTRACGELSIFLAWHSRSLIYEDPDFLPPAKLWVFQTLLIIEIFEKLYSTRSLHERAHVHHATTLTLMRRGSSLIGRSANDSSSDDTDPTRTPPGPDGSINTAGRNTPDAWWNYWISNEATRRTAFAAFIIDTTHATMFGHSAVMVADEMRIPLPCDETLWSAKSGPEVQRLERALTIRGISPLSFLEGLKRTLNGQPVRTNIFGRVILMSGLLSINWNQKMQDVRVNTIGVGKLSSWGSQLLHAFDNWKQDFDASLAISGSPHFHGWCHPHGLDFDNVFESRTVLHCLAHMAMHVDIIDCQIFAGAKRLLGRAISSDENAAAVKRMKESWAPSARARDATFYALRFLSEVLIPEDHALGTGRNTSPGLMYSARDDNLLNRPWVLYFAALVVWSYGFALDGPIAPPTYTLSTSENKIHDMQGFLRRVGRIRSPEDLQSIKHRNSCLGLLMLLRDMFRDTRWELLHESAALLRNCIDMLMPGISE